MSPSYPSVRSGLVGTGILYAVIVVAWAAYLVPLVKQHRQETAANRSVERFATAMRVLGKRSSSSRSRLTAPPPRTNPGAVRTLPGLSAERPVGRRRTGSSAVAAVRRRRVLAVLAASTVTVGVLVVLHLVPRWALAIPAGLIVAFLAATRLSLRRADRNRQQADAAVDERALSGVALESARPARRIDSAYAPRLSAALRQATPTLPSTATDPVAGMAGTTVAPAARADDTAQAWVAHSSLEAWDPVPVTLPTYLTKDRATPRRVRTIDLSCADAFSAARLPEAGLLRRQPDGVDTVATAAADDIIGDDGNRAATG